MNRGLGLHIRRFIIAKRGERGILPEARDEGEEKYFFLLPSSRDSRFSRAWRKMPC